MGLAPSFHRSVIFSPDLWRFLWDKQGSQRNISRGHWTRVASMSLNLRCVPSSNESKIRLRPTLVAITGKVRTRTQLPGQLKPDRQVLFAGDTVGPFDQRNENGRIAELCVPIRQIVFRDPTGPRASPSSKYRNVFGDDLLA